MKEKIVLLYGGKSVEHDISIITAHQISQFLPKEYSFQKIYIDKDGVWWIADNLDNLSIYKNFKKYAKNKTKVSILLGSNILTKEQKSKLVPYQKIKAVLNCCHGKFGESGSVQGLLELCDIPQTSGGSTSSSICMDKCFMKDILLANKMSTLDYKTIKKIDFENKKNEVTKEIEEKIKYPLITKPANLGSSIGIKVCRNHEEFEDGLSLAFTFDKKVLIEHFVENAREFNCACFQYSDQYFTSDVVEVLSKKDIYSFENKYIEKSEDYKNVEAKIASRIKNFTKTIYNLFDCKGIVRVDFLYDSQTKKIYINEINTIPGALSLYMFKGVKPAEILKLMIEESIKTLEKEKQEIETFDSDAIESYQELKSFLKK